MKRERCASVTRWQEKDESILDKNQNRKTNETRMQWQSTSARLEHLVMRGKLQNENASLNIKSWMSYELEVHHYHRDASSIQWHRLEKNYAEHMNDVQKWTSSNRSLQWRNRSLVDTFKLKFELSRRDNRRAFGVTQDWDQHKWMVHVLRQSMVARGN